MIRFQCTFPAVLALVSIISCSIILTTDAHRWSGDESSGIDLSEHERIRRAPAEDTTTTSTTPKPEKKKSEKPKPSPDFPKLELDPETETVSPNDTESEPELPDVEGFPPLMPTPGGGPFPPGLFPGPFGPSAPPPSFPPGFEICYNPLVFQPLPSDSKAIKKQKNLVKMQCDLQTKLKRFQQNIQRELLELKKLNYNLVARIDRLETMLQASPF